MTTKTNSVLIKVREIMLITSTLVTMCGLGGIFITFGEYKANFAELCKKVGKIEIVIDANAAENREDHFNIYKELYGVKNGKNQTYYRR